MHNWAFVIVIFVTFGAALSACSGNSETAELARVVDVEPTVSLENSTETFAMLSDKSTQLSDLPLPNRTGPPTQTSGTVPHIQIGVEPIPAVYEELLRLAFSLPGVEDRPTIVSLPGARGMWLSDDIVLAHPEVIVSGREFAHIHADGSLHAPLPYERALEVAEKGWGDRHPWADEREGWDGFVLLFTPISMGELEVILQLIVESYNFVTGQKVQASDF